MMKCPHCGSTAQMAQIALDYVTYSHSVETWRCGCGCVVRRTMKVMNQMIEYPNGTVELKEE